MSNDDHYRDSLPESIDTTALAPSDPYRRAEQTFPKLSEEQLERIATYGIRETLAKGTPTFTRGERGVDFFAIVRGSIEIVDPSQPADREVITVHRARQFTGEMDLFNNREILVSGRMGEDGEVIRLNRPQFRKLLAAETDLGELVMRAFILRRTGLIAHAQGGVRIVGRHRSNEVLTLERFLRRNGYPLEVLDVGGEQAQAAKALLDECELDHSRLPVVVLPGGEVLEQPDVNGLAEVLGLVEPIDTSTVHDVVIVGAGPAGLAAAVYAASEGLAPIVVEALAPGGQAGTSSRIENYLGFPTGISGPALAGRAQLQAMKFGATICLPRAVEKLECDSFPYRLTMDTGDVLETRTVVVASGARYRSLDLEETSRYEGLGIHYAATAMEGDLCEGEIIAVVGGGNSAGQAAVFLSGRAQHVYMLVRREGLASTMSSYLVDRIDASPRITLLPFTEVCALHGARHLEAVSWRNRETGEEDRQPVSNLFLMIGAVPNTGWLNGCVDVDQKGFVEVGRGEVATASAGRRPARLLETSRAGVFAAGDVRSGSTKRVASAVGEGAIAVQFVHAALAESG